MLSVLSLAPITEVLLRRFLRLFMMIEERAHLLLVANLAGRPAKEAGAGCMFGPARLKRFASIRHPVCCETELSSRFNSGKPIAAPFSPPN